MKLVHINIVARNADALADFYRIVFGCEDRRPPTSLSGKKVSRGNGLPNSEIYSVWLNLPNTDTPFLEIHEHKEVSDRRKPTINEPGFGHLSFEVEDAHATLAAIIAAGGTAVGEITDFGSVDTPFLIVYVRDPEGNFLELEQPHCCVQSDRFGRRAAIKFQSHPFHITAESSFCRRNRNKPSNPGPVALLKGDCSRKMPRSDVRCGVAPKGLCLE